MSGVKIAYCSECCHFKHEDMDVKAIGEAIDFIVDYAKLY